MRRVASSTSSFRPAYWLALVLGLAVCFGAQTLVLRLTGGRTTKSESNFFSSVARLQSGIRGTPRVMLLGSSITGRLPDRNRGFEGVGNLGCDGGSAAEILRAMDKGIIPRAPELIVEGNTLYRAVGAGETELAAALGKQWFRRGVAIPNLGAAARPSSVAYTLLMERKMGSASAGSAPVIPTRTRPVLVAGAPAQVSPAGNVLLDELTGILARLTAAGTKIIIVMLPPGAQAGTPNRVLPEELARRSGLPFWDLAAAIPPDSVRFTDGVHMDPPSAAATLRTLLDATGD